LIDEDIVLLLSTTALALSSFSIMITDILVVKLFDVGVIIANSVLLSKVLSKRRDKESGNL